MLGSGLNLVTTVIGFGMSATFIVFICARLICGRIRSGDSPAGAGAAFDLELRSDLDPRERAGSGLEPVAVAAIPTVKYSSGSFESQEDSQCSICLADYQEKEILRVMPTCNHNFHLVCIDVWLQKQPTCPICRLPLNETFEESPIFEAFEGPNDTEASRGHRDSEGINNNQMIHNSVSVNIEVLRGVPETGT